MDTETILQGLGTLLKEAQDRVTLIQAAIDTISGKIAPEVASITGLEDRIAVLESTDTIKT